MSEKKYVLITGTAGDIGQALCRVLSEAGYSIIASDYDEAECISDHFVKADLSLLVNEAAYENKVIKDIRIALNGEPLYGIVNNAAIQLLGSADELSIVDFRSSHDINTVAPLLLIKRFLVDLETSKGAIVNIGSIHTRATKPGFISYTSSKSALAGLTKALAVDLGEKIRINSVQPAAVETKMLKASFDKNPSAYKKLETYHPLGRVAMPEEVAAAVLFLISEQASFITGSTIRIDGGIGCRLHDPL